MAKKRTAKKTELKKLKRQFSPRPTKARPTARTAFAALAAEGSPSPEPDSP